MLKFFFAYFHGIPRALRVGFATEVLFRAEHSTIIILSAFTGFESLHQSLPIAETSFWTRVRIALSCDQWVLAWTLEGSSAVTFQTVVDSPLWLMTYDLPSYGVLIWFTVPSMTSLLQRGPNIQSKNGWLTLYLSSYLSPTDTPCWQACVVKCRVHVWVKPLMTSPLVAFLEFSRTVKSSQQDSFQISSTSISLTINFRWATEVIKIV